MKLDSATTEITLSNVGVTGEFRIRNSAKAFNILSSGLYKNKIRAIVRELGCNAVDSHVAAGKKDIPFEVHLPTMLEPWFAVRDFGLGLDNDSVVNIYTTYFESTKTDSNNFIGALGLGSKSPFSYTDNFSVTAIKNGTKRIYSAFINESGVPSIAAMGEELTDEENGVEVKFSVVDRYDYQTFKNEAYYIFSWFKQKPTITGVSDFKHLEIPYTEQNIVPGVHLHSHNNIDGPIATMGNIAYPLNNIPEVKKHFGELSELLRCNLVLEFEIGELDFTASREELSYIPLTIASIKKKLELLNANLATHLATKADAITNEWDRAEYLSIESQTILYRAAVAKYVNDTKFPLFENGRKKPFTFYDTDLESRKLVIKGIRLRNGQGSSIGSGQDYINSAYVSYTQIPIEKDVIIVLNDLKTGCVERARYHYGTQGHKMYSTIFCVSHSDPDLAVRQTEYDKFVSQLHNPPLVVRASELEKRVVVKKPLSTDGIMDLVLKKNERPGYASSYTWAPHEYNLDDKKIYYYTCLSNYTSIRDDNTAFDVMALKALMSECGVPDISGIEIMGVRKNRIKEIKQLKNWVWIEDKIKEETAKVTDKHIVSLVVAEMLDGYYNKVYTNKKVANLVGPDSEYTKFVNEYGGIVCETGKIKELVELCGKYGKSVQVEVIKKKIEDAKQSLYSTYPLLKFFKEDQGAYAVDVAEYIRLIDNKSKLLP